MDFRQKIVNTDAETAGKHALTHTHANAKIWAVKSVQVIFDVGVKSKTDP